MRVLFLFCSLFMFCTSLQAQVKIETPSYQVNISAQGNILFYVNKKGLQNDTVSFHSKDYAGPSFKDVNFSLLKKSKNQASFYGIKNNVVYNMDYSDQNGIFMMKITLFNKGNNTFIPSEGVGLRLGLNTYMIGYPQWNKIYFPTFLRSEKTHFFSYFMTPQGKIFTIVSPDPIASWHCDYQQIPLKDGDKTILVSDHRIYTVYLDLLHRLPLPQRHPQNMYSLQPGEKKVFRLLFKSSESLNEVYSDFYTLTQAPVISAKYYTLPVGKTFEGNIRSEQLVRLEIRTPRSEVDTLQCKDMGNNQIRWQYSPYSGEGLYVVTATDIHGKISEMNLFVRPDYSEYLTMARKEALRSQPTHIYHAECFYPLFTYFLARRYLPDTEDDALAEQVYDRIFPDLYDDKTGEMREGKNRIQDAASMAGILTDRYQVTHVEKDLEQASLLADFLIRCQLEDGAYYNLDHKTHYTSVIYIAKSIMELLTEEQHLATTSDKWEKRYRRHLNSITKALDNLALFGDNIQTEGQMTFEDGMISCSITQLAYGALRVNDPIRADRYLQRAVELEKKHRCLTQLLMPDCRTNGSTLRFWEYPYTVNLMHGAFNSPCGWSSWKIYGSWYLYLLTGNYTYMENVVNAMGSCLQLMDINTKKLNFSFLPDPFIDCNQYEETPSGSGIPKIQHVIVGEQYVPQISNWHKEPNQTWRQKWGIDNFVHEIFKCMTEIFIQKAYIHENENGTFECLNCEVKNENGRLEIQYDPQQIQYVHTYFQKDRTVLFRNESIVQPKGSSWVKGNIPEDLVPYTK